MPNFNDAKISSLYVNGDGAVSDIQDDAPNAPNGGQVRRDPRDGGRRGRARGLHPDHHLHRPDGQRSRPGRSQARAPLNTGAGHFQGAEWKKVPPAGPPAFWTFNHSVKVGPPAVAGHAYRYTAVLYNTNGQIVSVKESEPFILL